MIKCDIWGADIVDGQCSCGTWSAQGENETHPMKESLELFHDMKRFTLTGDMPHLGCAVVYFRGDYNDCQSVPKFIYKMKNRPFYED
jgi:hypothetical protein